MLRAYASWYSIDQTLCVLLKRSDENSLQSEMPEIRRLFFNWKSQIPVLLCPYFSETGILEDLKGNAINKTMTISSQRIDVHYVGVIEMKVSELQQYTTRVVLLL